MTSSIRKLGAAAACSVATLVAVRALRRQQRWFSYYNKVVLITGGSRGLGLEIARIVAKMGAKVAICARTDEDLQRARAELEDIARDVMTIRCDVSYQTDVNEMIKSVTQRWGRLDVLFNVAGIIEVGPLESMTQDDFKRAMDTHFWGPLYTMLAAIPHMKAKGFGRILNVSSMGGKRAVPHMIPYDASKFALVGLSQGMRAELVKDGIYVTTACPSLMRTGSPRNASFKAQHRKEYAWFSIGDSMPLLSMNAERAAKLMVSAAQYGDADLVLPSLSRIALALGDLMPNLSADLMYLMNALLPKMGGIGSSSAYGHESESELSESILTRLGRKAALRNNEVRP